MELPEVGGWCVRMWFQREKASLKGTEEEGMAYAKALRQEHTWRLARLPQRAQKVREVTAAIVCHPGEESDSDTFFNHFFLSAGQITVFSPQNLNMTEFLEKSFDDDFLILSFFSPILISSDLL